MQSELVRLVDALVRTTHPVLKALDPVVIRRLQNGAYIGTTVEAREALLGLERHVQDLKNARDALLLYAAQQVRQKFITHDEEGTAHGYEEGDGEEESGTEEEGDGTHEGGGCY